MSRKVCCYNGSVKGPLKKSAIRTMTIKNNEIHLLPLKQAHTLKGTLADWGHTL